MGKWTIFIVKINLEIIFTHSKIESNCFHRVCRCFALSRYLRYDLWYFFQCFPLRNESEVGRRKGHHTKSCGKNEWDEKIKTRVKRINEKFSDTSMKKIQNSFLANLILVILFLMQPFCHVIPQKDLRWQKWKVGECWERWRGFVITHLKNVARSQHNSSWFEYFCRTVDSCSCLLLSFGNSFRWATSTLLKQGFS